MPSVHLIDVHSSNVQMPKLLPVCLLGLVCASLALPVNEHERVTGSDLLSAFLGYDMSPYSPQTRELVVGSDLQTGVRSGADATSLRSLIHVTEVQLTRNIIRTGQWPGKMYVSARADSSADVLWTSAEAFVMGKDASGKDVSGNGAVWTRLQYGKDGKDSRAMADRVLEAPNRQTANGIVSLPSGRVAVAREGPVTRWHHDRKTGAAKRPMHSARSKYIAEFDANGTMLREAEVVSGDEGWTHRPFNLVAGYSACAKGVAYTIFGETCGGGHFGSRQVRRLHSSRIFFVTVLQRFLLHLCYIWPIGRATSITRRSSGVAAVLLAAATPTGEDAATTSPSVSTSTTRCRSVAPSASRTALVALYFLP